MFDAPSAGAGIIQGGNHRNQSVSVDDLLTGFEFADDGNVSRSAAISMLMTPVLRGMILLAPGRTWSRAGRGSPASMAVLSAELLLIVPGWRSLKHGPRGCPKHWPHREGARNLSGLPMMHGRGSLCGSDTQASGGREAQQKTRHMHGLPDHSGSQSAQDKGGLDKLNSEPALAGI